MRGEDIRERGGRGEGGGNSKIDAVQTRCSKDQIGQISITIQHGGRRGGAADAAYCLNTIISKRQH